MTSDLEQWLPRAGVTLDNAPDAPRALYERLKFTADILKSCAGVPHTPVLMFRACAESASFREIGHELAVGREKPSNLVIGSDRLSRRHFRVFSSGEIVCIQDLGSRNGTYVNGKRVQSVPLKDGDIVEAGGQVFVFLMG